MNTVNILGRIANDLELRQTQTGKAVVSFTVANSTGWGDNKQTNWLDCVAWEKKAETICKHLEKGSGIGITGELRTRAYVDSNGSKRKVTEILVTDITFIEGKKAEAAADQKPYAATAAEFEEMTADDSLPF